MDKALSTFGVEFLSSQEVKEEYPAFFKTTEIEVDLTEANEDVLLTKDNYTLKVEKPDQNNVQWMSYRSTNKYYRGERYNVQRLIAQSNRYDSNLKGTGSKIHQIDFNWKVGTENVLKAVGSTAVGEIPGSSFVVNGYGFLSTFLDGINRDIEVDVPSITYTWSYNTTVSFSYVRLESQTDDDQRLAFISSKVQTSCGYQMPGFDYTKSDGNWNTNTTIESGTKMFTMKPSKYNSVDDSIKAYTNSYEQSRDRVSRIKLLGPKDTKIQYIYPVSPEFPGQIY